MLLEPTDALTAPATIAALAEIRRDCPSASHWPDQEIADLMAGIANMAYSGQRFEVWEHGDRLGIDKTEFKTIVRLTMTEVYPVALITGDAAIIALS